MRKFSLFALVAVLSFGFVGCATSHVRDSGSVPQYISVSVSYVEYVPMEAPKEGEYPTGLTHTTVVFNWNGFRSDPVNLMGDVRKNLTVGLECKNLELASWSQSDTEFVGTYLFTYERMGYLVSFTVPFNKN